MEQKYQIGNEYGSIMWDIEKLLKDIEMFRIRAFDVKHLALTNPFHGDKEYAMNTDITKPLIVVHLTQNINKLIDGNHRLQKALSLGATTINAYCLSFEEHRDYIVNFDEDIYHNVVSHWKE